MSRQHFIDTLDAYAVNGRTVQLWLRDDDAIKPTAALSQLLEQSKRWNAPMTIAAIPADATTELARLLIELPLISVAVHGWDHTNHAPASEKKQELGLHRGEDVVLARLAEGLERIAGLFGDRAVPLLVPPWNRIAPALVDRLPSLGYEALSVFGPERDGAPVRLVNTHVDIIDWKGARGGRSMDSLYAEAATRLGSGDARSTSLGVLTHHLVHDDAAWDFLDDFFTLTAVHPACRWVPVSALMQRP
ncbi:polysaccharide deacetylase family protein [Rhizobium wenxiniae]|uniref:polysaccharide deacetylase family protein n=1 Tax=Rhizobium wenxiniae TaxID=1737357 RepID=UPI003C14C523